MKGKDGVLNSKCFFAFLLGLITTLQCYEWA